MILGLLIVIGGAIFFYATKNAQKPFEPQIKISQEQIPVQFVDIKKYAEDCAYSAAAEGLKIIGKQGGYISLTNRTLSKEPFNIRPEPTESDAVIFSQDSELRIPYWWYMKSANSCTQNCQFSSKRPELKDSDNSMQKQLERFVTPKFQECINNFETFRQQGFKITSDSEIKTDVLINSEDVSVNVNYPITIEYGSSKSQLSQFSATLPVNLNRVYELATKITNLEIEHHYLEKQVLNSIVAFSGTDSSKLPPISDMQFSFGSSVGWQKSDVKNKITGLLSSYIPLFQAEGTYNYDRNAFGSELKQRLYDATIIPLANSSFNNYAAYFTYLDFWPAYFNLNCNGERCIPSSTMIPLISFGVQNYKFAYDLSFPVLVEVQDPYAFNNKGYSFYFFLEGNIRGNRPMGDNFTRLSLLPPSERSQLCDLKTSANVTAKISDSVTGKPVDGAQIIYSLIEESCFIGSTGNDGILNEKFPIGAGGAVSLIKDGYIGKAIEFDANIDSEKTINAKMSPVYTKNIVVRKKSVVKTPAGWKFFDTPSDLNEKESAIVTLTRINKDDEIDFSSGAAYAGQQNESSQIELAPGDYTADATLVLNDRIIIPEREKCVDVIGPFYEKCYNISKIDFGGSALSGSERFPEGGLKLNFTITPQDLQSRKTIVIYAVSIDIAGVPEKDRVIEDLEQMEKIESYAATYDLALQPGFE